MDVTFLVYFKWIVIGAMFAAVGILVLICLYYFLRWQAFQPFRRDPRYTTFGEEKDEEEEEEANRRRRKIRYWFWGGR